jgi:hypothetical protein
MPPDETSPLLASSTAPSPGARYVDVLAQAGEANGTTGASGIANEAVNGIEPGTDEERQAGLPKPADLYEGLPEVRKQLRFIVPSVAVGVRVPVFLSWALCGVVGLGLIGELALFSKRWLRGCFDSWIVEAC